MPPSSRYLAVALKGTSRDLPRRRDVDTTRRDRGARDARALERFEIETQDGETRYYDLPFLRGADS
jgi:hypothetical protein